MSNGQILRSAEGGDQDQINRLINEASQVHRHLDWRMPSEWIGHNPFYLLENEHWIRSLMACPDEGNGISWIRAFASSRETLAEKSWFTLWEAVKDYFQNNRGIRIIALSKYPWMDNLLVKSGFNLRQHIVMLNWHGTHFDHEESHSGLNIRRMEAGDINAVTNVDHDAFEDIWRNSADLLQKAYSMAEYSSVAETNGQIVGYQISTRNSMGAHLARLAVLPQFQGNGIGHLMVADLKRIFTQEGVHMISVNTQSDNLTSRRLYKKLGFHETGEILPVYEICIPSI